MFLLSLIAAVAAPPPITVVRWTDDPGFTLRSRNDPVDAWTFSVHYDPRVRKALAGKVYGRRAMFSQGVIVGAAAIVVGMGWFIGSRNARRSRDQAPLLLSAAGTLLMTTAIVAAAHDKSRSLRPLAHWTAEEALILARGGSITHGLTIVPTPHGWTVINRAGRPLSAVEVAARLGERSTLRRARRNNVAANVLTEAAVAAGSFGVIGGLSMATNDLAKTDWRLTGAGAMGAGVGLILAGIVGKVATTKQQTAQAYWMREELQVLLDVP